MYILEEEQVLYLGLEQRCLWISGVEGFEARKHPMRVMKSILDETFR